MDSPVIFHQVPPGRNSGKPRLIINPDPSLLAAYEKNSDGLGVVEGVVTGLVPKHDSLVFRLKLRGNLQLVLDCVMPSPQCLCPEALFLTEGDKMLAYGQFRTPKKKFEIHWYRVGDFRSQPPPVSAPSFGYNSHNPPTLVQHLYARKITKRKSSSPKPVPPPLTVEVKPANVFFFQR